MNELQRQFDRMADGELTVEQQRALLLECEQTQNWRGLALAYVEAQAWGREFKSLKMELDEPVNDRAAGDSSGRGRNRDQHGLSILPNIWHPLSLAASVLLLLGLGYGLGWWWQGKGNDLSPGRGSVAEMNDMRAESGGNLLEPSTKSPPQTSLQITVSDPVSNELRQIDVPTVRASMLGEEWQMQRAIPQNVIDQLRVQGHEITQQRWLIPIRTADGERVVVPVDYVNFQHGYGAFQ